MNVYELRATVQGSVVAPGDGEWDAARAYHSGTGEPELVVRAQAVADVQACVRYAADEGLPVNIRGGGHSAWGTLPGGLTVDLGGLRDIDVDGHTVHVGGGAVWGDVARALLEHGLGISAGDTASVGVGGLTVGGGIGWMVRAWGLAADQLIGVQLVTADGRVVEATTSSDPELLWALRGGGGNFGVVTRFDFRAHPLDGVVFARLDLADDADARAVLRTLRDILRDAPRELTVTYMDVPPMDPSAPPGATISACWIGDDLDAARLALGPLLDHDDVSEGEIVARSYPEILLEAPRADPAEPMPGFIGGNALFVLLTDDAIDALVSFREANAASVLFLRSLGGAFSDVPQEQTAFPARDATWFAMAGAFDIPGTVTDETRPGIQSAWDEIVALGDGVYGNFLTSTDPEWSSRMYPPHTMARLREVKSEWDPQNVFSRNHNVRPV